MTAIIIGLCAMFIYSDIRVAVYVGIGFLLAKALINSMMKK